MGQGKNEDGREGKEFMFRKQVPVILVAAFWAAAPCLAQDSVSKTACLPGDATSPWADASAALGSEQCDNYVVDLAPLTTSWGNQFGIAPIIKSSKTGADFFGSLVSAQSISRLQSAYQRFRPGVYWEWSDAGYGVNNDPAISTQGTPIATAALTGHQFGVIFSEFATTGTTLQPKDYNAVIGGMVHIQPDDPARLFVQRIVAAVNSCNDLSELAAIGVGTVDANGYIHFRADGNGTSPGGCVPALNPVLFQERGKLGAMQCMSAKLPLKCIRFELVRGSNMVHKRELLFLPTKGAGQ